MIEFQSMAEIVAFGSPIASNGRSRSRKEVQPAYMPRAPSLAKMDLTARMAPVNSPAQHILADMPQAIAFVVRS